MCSISLLKVSSEIALSCVHRTNSICDTFPSLSLSNSSIMSSVSTKSSGIPVTAPSILRTSASSACPDLSVSIRLKYSSHRAATAASSAAFSAAAASSAAFCAAAASSAAFCRAAFCRAAFCAWAFALSSATFCAAALATSSATFRAVAASSACFCAAAAS